MHDGHAVAQLRASAAGLLYEVSTGRIEMVIPPAILHQENAA